MTVPNYIRPFPLIAFNATTLNAVVYKALNPLGFTHPIFFLRIINRSDAQVYIGFDEKVDHLTICPLDTFECNFQVNNELNSLISLIKKGARLWARGTAAKAGYIYMTGFYY